MEKIKTLIWFLQRPGLYLQLLYQTRQSLFPHPKENTRKEATKWCEEVAVDNVSALQKLTKSEEYVDIEVIYADDFSQAHETQKNLPLKMGGAGNYVLLYNLSNYFRPETIVETGVAYGWSSMALLLAIEKCSSGNLISIDMPYAKLGNESFVGCVIPSRLKKYWTLIRKPDRQGLREALQATNQIDLCHYDSDKSYRGRMWAYPRLWNNLRNGGVFISDDINDNFAFKDFAESIGIKPVVVRWNQQFVGIILKPEQ